jgi:hypothetical protein
VHPTETPGRSEVRAELAAAAGPTLLARPAGRLLGFGALVLLMLVVGLFVGALVGPVGSAGPVPASVTPGAPPVLPPGGHGGHR